MWSLVGPKHGHAQKIFASRLQDPLSDPYKDRIKFSHQGGSGSPGVEHHDGNFRAQQPRSSRANRDVRLWLVLCI